MRREEDDVLNLDAHDGEDEPEHEADEEHVDDRRDRVHQGVHHNLIVTVINALEMMIITLFMKVMEVHHSHIGQKVLKFV